MKASPFKTLLVLSLLAVAAPAFAQYNGVPANGMMTKGDLPSSVQPADLQKISFDQKLNAQLPLDTTFRDEAGRTITLSDYFHHQKPVIVTFIYYDCPMLCSLVLNGVVGAMKGMSLEPGRDYDLVTVSFNPRETPKLAGQKKQTYVKSYGHPEVASAWHFLTGDDPEIKRLTQAAGFHYVWDPQINQYAHAAGIMIATADGHLSKYLYGIEFAPRELRMALVDASAGRIGNPVDRVLLYCYHYDPASGKYGLVILNVIRLGGVVTIAVLALAIGIFASRERRKNKSMASSSDVGGPGGFGEPGETRKV